MGKMMSKDIPFELETTAKLKNYNTWISDSLDPFVHGSLIEIGSGIGTFSDLFIDQVDNLTLIEPSHKLCARLEQKFSKRTNVEIIQSPLEDLETSLANRYFDCAVLINVLEHIREDKEALRIIFKLLKPGGYLLIFVPALMSLFSDLDAAVGHHRRYHLSELEDKVKIIGFKTIKIRYFDLLGAISWWLINVILKRQSIDDNAAIFYDRVGVPLTRCIESCFKPPFGKNLILIAKK